jgi:hypothetical protein
MSFLFTIGFVVLAIASDILDLSLTETFLILGCFCLFVIATTAMDIHKKLTEKGN